MINTTLKLSIVKRLFFVILNTVSLHFIMAQIKIHTDGSSLGNPGRGGFAAIIHEEKKEIIIKGGEPNTTNNRMEMTAIIKALEWVQKNSPNAQITLYSDSNLLVKSLEKGWKRKANLDLWTKLDKARKGLNITYKWIKGHAYNKYNKECDRLAVKEANKRHVQTSKSAFFCSSCNKETEGVLSLLPDSSLIRVDCKNCNKFIKFAEKTQENVARARKRPLLTKKQLDQIVKLKMQKGEIINEKKLQKIKKLTKEEAEEFIKCDQRLF